MSAPKISFAPSKNRIALDKLSACRMPGEHDSFEAWEDRAIRQSVENLIYDLK
ncbi:hypothetical protein AAB992_28740 [Burkholderia contaminans]|uniref:hypothetical protein n=1 Tax=Burkholderia contaminans TaxID=488447 RepID=UPI002417BAC5|nr:hypothetical protein [Burkholderia contaminans]WFN15384.1 hypothetical protein LXE92_34990 [Burkholderia contaminans]